MANTKANENKTIGAKWLKEQGYPVPETIMGGYINAWWEWMRATSAFYDSTDVGTDGNTYKIERITMTPAKMVCEDWASLLFNDETIINLAGVSDLEEGQKPAEDLARTNDWLQAWVERSELLECSSPIERCFGIGTAAYSLGLKDINDNGTANQDADVTLHWSDARSIIPLSWTNKGVTAAAFTTTVVVDGKTYTQVTLHAPEDVGYVIKTAFFKGNGQRVELDGFTTEVRTKCNVPTFAIITPAIDNTYEDYSPFGVSVLDRCIGTIKVSDGAFDNLWKDLFLGQKLLLLSESLLKQDEDGNYIVPRSRSQQLFMGTDSDSVEGKELVYEYNPDLRVSDNRQAINTGLALLGKRAGFGSTYYSLDKDGNVAKTAKEVATSNAELVRNAHKHEKKIEPAISSICEAAVALAKQFIDPSLSNVKGLVSVNFGDTVVDDDTTERENDRADVAAGLLPAYRYIMKWQGVDEDTARDWAGEDEEPIPEA